MKKYIAYILTGAITFGALSPLTYATPLYQSNIEFEQNQAGTGLSQVVVYDSLNNPRLVTLDNQGPVVPQSTAYYKEKVAGVKTAIVKATETGTAGLWKVVAQDSKDANALQGGEFSGDSASQIAEVTLPNEFNVQEDHLYVVDNGGNISSPISLVEDTTPPSATATYPGGGIVLNVTDQVGIAEINGTSYSDYPTATSYPVPANTESVTVTDALDNSTAIPIDVSVPQITRVAKKGTTVMLTVTSAGLDLDKISESAVSTDDGIHNFTSNSETVFLNNVTADTLYVYDIAGKAAEIDLTDEQIVDEAAPSYVGPTYVNGEIKLYVTDAKAGIKSINGITEDYVTYPTTQQEYTVPANVLEVTLVDALNNSVSVPIDRVLPQITNIYVGDQGKTMLTASDASGISAVKYYVTGEDPQVVDIAGCPTTTPIEIPANITSIGVVDGFGNESPLDLASIAKPTIQNIYKKAANVYSVETNGISEIYCKNPTKQVLVANPQAINTVEVPEGVTTIYVTDTNENEVAIDISGVESTVTRAILSQDALNMMVNISSTSNITSLTYLNAQNNQVGTAVNVGQATLTGVREVPDNAVAFRLNYVNGRTCKVVLDRDLSAPQATSVYRTSDGKVNITLEDNAGLARIAYYVDGQEQSTAISNAPTSYTCSLQLPEGVKRILVYDVFDDVTPVKVGEDAVSTTVDAATKSEDGSKAQININTGKPITSIIYVYPDGSTQTKNILGNTGEFNGTLDDINGATEIIFTHADGSQDVIPLTVDDSEPQTSNAHVVDGKVVITVSDPSGVQYIKDEEGNIIYTFDPPVTSGEATLPAGTTGIKVCDVLGNESEQAIEIDTEEIPTVENVYINEDGNLCVDTTGITGIYYRDENGDMQELEGNPSESNELEVPEGVSEIFFEYGQGGIISMPIGRVPEISKAVVSEDGSKIAFETTKQITKVECYNDQDQVIDTITGNDIGDIMSVDAEGTVYIIVTYSDGTTNRIELERQAPSEQDNAYKSNDDGSTTVTFISNAGIKKITYELDGETYEIPVGGDPTATVEIPEGAQNVQLVDIFDIPEEIEMPLNPPTVEKPQKDEEGNIIIITPDPIVYTGPDGQPHTEYPDENGVIKIPGEVTEIMIPDAVPPIGMNLSNITTTVGHATVNENGDKLALNISGDKVITQVECYDENGEYVGTIDISGVVDGDGTSINGTVDLPEGTNYVKVKYQGGTSTKVTFKEDEEDPQASNVTQMGNGNIAVTLEDKAGIDRIEYVDENGVRRVIDIEGNPTKITEELDLPDGVTTIYVYDSFGNPTEVPVGQDAVSTTIDSATVSGDGSQASIDIESDKPISTITYVDENGIKHTIDVHNETEYSEIIDTYGATSLTIIYQDGTKSVIELSRDNEGPAVSNVCREYKTLSLTIADPSGIDRVVDENGIDLAPGIEGEFEASIRVAITNDLDEIYVYDRFENRTRVMLSDYPWVDNIQKKEDGTISVDTDGITEIYYYNEIGRKIVLDPNPDGTSEIKLPEGVTDFYMKDESGNEIKKSVEDVKEIEKTVLKGTEVLFDMDTEDIEEIVCYSSTGRVLGTGTVQNGKVTVPEGTASMRIVYDDGSTNKVELEPYAETSDSNAYQSGEDGMVTMTLENSSGIDTITYTLGGQQYTIDLGGVTSGQVEIPSDAENIEVTDGFGETKQISIPQDMPRVTDIQKDADGNVVVTSNKTLYYKNEQGQDCEVETDEAGRAVIPEGVDEVFTKEGNEVGITIDVSQVSTTVGAAAISEDGDKISINVDSTKAISQIVFYGANNQPIGSAVEVTGNSVNRVIEGVPEDTAYVKVEYVGGSSTKVVLEQDDGEPQASNTVMLENGKKLVTLEDAAGISRITYVDENEEVQEIVVNGNPTKVVQELDLEGVDQITVYDMFGTPKEVDITEQEMETVVTDMATNKDGSGVFLSLYSEKGIDKLEYVDDYGAKHEIAIDNNIDEFTGAVDTTNANSVVVTHRDGTTSEIPLVVVSATPSNNETVKDGEGKNIKTNVYDRRGIKSITYGEQVVTEGLEKYPKSVVLQIKIVDALGLSVGSPVSVMNDEGSTVVTITSDEPDGDVTVTNVVNNEGTLNLGGATVDDTEPEASVDLQEGYFVLTATDEESGILRVVAKETNTEIFTPAGCPTTFVSPQTQYPQGVKNLIVYNGVGMPKEVSIARADTEAPKILWAYKNLEKNYIYLVVTDESGIDRIEDENGNVRMVFDRE